MVGMAGPVGGGEGIQTRTIAIAVGVACGYILLVVFLVGWCAWRRRKGLQKLQVRGDSCTPESRKEGHVPTHSQNVDVLKKAL